MASAAVMAAVESKLATVWPTLCTNAGLTSAPPIIPPNEGSGAPADGSGFLAVEYPVANEQMMSVGAPGANIWREDGGFLLTLVAPIGGGLRNSATPWAALMDALRAAFRGSTITVGSGFMTVFEASPPAFKEDSERGAYCELSSAITYWFDVVG